MGEKDGLILRDYSKVVFFYPLLVYSFIAYIIQAVSGTDLIDPLGWIWVLLFFMNLFVIAFDMNLKSLIMLVVVGILLFTILALTKVIDFSTGLNVSGFVFPMGIQANFYLLVTLILGILVIIAVIQGRLHYVEIERNEVQIHGFADTGVKQYPIADMSYDLIFDDVFESLALGAGTIRFKFKDGKTVELLTVPLLNKKRKLLDQLRNTTSVSIQKP